MTWLKRSHSGARRTRLCVEALESRTLLATYFVAPGGSDGGSGSADQPLATIAHALTRTQPGDEVLLRSGSYREKVAVPHGGSAAGGFITLQAAPGERPILDGTGAPGGNMIQLHNISYFRIAGLEIANLRVNDGSGIRITGAGTDLELRNNRIHDIRGKSAMGITVYGTAPAPIARLTVDGNEIFRCEPAQSEALVLNGNVTNFSVTRNHVHHVNNIGIDLIGGERDIHRTQVARHGIVRGNIVHHVHANYGGGFAAAIYVDGGRNIRIEQNTCYASDQGIEVGAENAGAIASGIVVRNNTVFGNDKGGLVFGGFESSAGRVRGCTFEGNTVYNNDRQRTGVGQIVVTFASRCVVVRNTIVALASNVLISADEGGTANRFDFNRYYTRTGPEDVSITFDGESYDTFADYRQDTGQDRNSRFLRAAPRPPRLPVVG